MITLMLVEDNPTQVKSLIEEFSDIDFIDLERIYRSGEACISDLNNSTSFPDFALVDVQMPGMNGVETVQQIKQIAPSVQCIMFSVLDDELTLYEAIQAGASGYFLKEDEIETISNHLRMVKEYGALPFTPRMAQKALDLMRSGNPEIPIEKTVLSQREMEILQFLAQGLSAQDIADRLFVSFHTVRKHMVNMYSKLEVNSKTEAVAKGLKNRWISM